MFSFSLASAVTRKGRFFVWDFVFVAVVVVLLWVMRKHGRGTLTAGKFATLTIILGTPLLCHTPLGLPPFCYLTTTTTTKQIKRYAIMQKDFASAVPFFIYLDIDTFV